jgi:hypothetical protein
VYACTGRVDNEEALDFGIVRTGVTPSQAAAVSFRIAESCRRVWFYLNHVMCLFNAM